MGLIYVDERVKNARFARGRTSISWARSRTSNAAAFENAKLYQRAAALSKILSAKGAASELSGDSEAMRSLKSEIRTFAAAPSSHVLIHGESGSGLKSCLMGV